MGELKEFNNSTDEQKQLIMKKNIKSAFKLSGNYVQKRESGVGQFAAVISG